MMPQPGIRALNLQKVRLLDRLANVNPTLANEIRNTKLDWFRIRTRNAAEEEPLEEMPEIDTGDAQVGEVYIYDEIGGSFGVGAVDFINQLNEIDAPEITIRINSPGGMLIEAIAMASAIAQHPSHITTRVDGIAASAASIIAISGDTCEMMDGSQLMIHRVMCGMQGNVDDCRETMAWLNEQDMNVASMYAKRTGMSSEECLALMKAETWMFAQEAIDLGLMDSMYTRLKQAGAFPPETDDPEEPDGDEPEEPGEDEPDAEEVDEDEVLNSLMHMSHRLTNRGFKYLGRNKAPKPAKANSFADLVDAWR